MFRHLNHIKTLRYLPAAFWLGGVLLVLGTLLFASAGIIFITAVLLMACCGILLAQYGFKNFFFLFLLSLPLSVKTSIGFNETTLMFPSELLTGILVFAFMFTWLFNSTFEKRFLFHPVTVSLLLYLLTTVLMLPFSSSGLISAKATVVRICYLIVSYFFMHLLLKHLAEKAYKPVLYYGASMVPVIIYVLFRHSQYGFSKDTSGYVTNPFYSDHTIYSACIAMILPTFIALSANSRLFNFNFTKRTLLLAACSVFMIAIFFSYCRATWISLAVVLLFSLALRFRIIFRQLIVFSIFCGTFAFMNRDAIVESLRKNRSDSNARHAGLTEQTKSIANISNDESNAERLNRWSCAIRMFAEKPLCGFGLGTYQFQYLGFQKESEMTRISVTSPYNVLQGRGGTAHSEYFLSLSETGIFPLSFFILALLFGVKTGMKIIYTDTNEKRKIIVKAALAGMLTYAVHALFNNFLDTDKAAFLFWSCLCIIVTADLEQKKNNAAELMGT